MSLMVSQEMILKHSHDIQTNDWILFHKQPWIIGRGQQTNKQKIQIVR